MVGLQSPRIRELAWPHSSAIGGGGGWGLQEYTYSRGQWQIHLYESRPRGGMWQSGKLTIEKSHFGISLPNSEVGCVVAGRALK